MSVVRFRSLLFQLNGVCSEARQSLWYGGRRWCADHVVSTNHQPTENTERKADSDQNLPIYAACVLARAPLIKPLPEDWEIDYQKWAEQIRSKKCEEIPKDWQKVKRTVHDEDDVEEAAPQWEPAPRITEADKSGHMKSLMRLLDQYLYLVLKHRSGEWSFPSTENRDGETIRQTGVRALKENVEFSDVFFIANWPIAHHRFNGEKARIEFYMKAQIISGQIEIKPESGFVDYVWISKNELIKYFSETKLEELMKKALV